jgi:hypothetical protein
MADCMTSQDDRDFRAAFESCTLTLAEFNHESHLRLAYVYLVEFDLASAQNRMRDGLRAFLASHGIPPEKFHETLTRAWMLAVRHFMTRSSNRSFVEFIANSAPLRDSRVMLTHYSSSLLFSTRARAAYVEPDLEAIPS